MPPIRPELLDELLKDYQKPEDLLGQDGLLQQLTKALVERALDGELTHHLGYEKHDAAGDNSGNSRNGTTPKTLKGKRGQVQLDVPRDRDSSFEPQLVKKGQTRFNGLDEKIISLYSRGMTQREIQGHLEEIYGVEISPSLISTVTDAVLDEVRAWQSTPTRLGLPDSVPGRFASEGQEHAFSARRKKPLVRLTQPSPMPTAIACCRMVKARSPGSRSPRSITLSGRCSRVCEYISSARSCNSNLRYTDPKLYSRLARMPKHGKTWRCSSQAYSGSLRSRMSSAAFLCLNTIFATQPSKL
jgi:hypothetical protein